MLKARNRKIIPITRWRFSTAGFELIMVLAALWLVIYAGL
jgi:hypothetical protein